MALSQSETREVAITHEDTPIVDQSYDNMPTLKSCLIPHLSKNRGKMAGLSALGEEARTGGTLEGPRAGACGRMLAGS